MGEVKTPGQVAWESSPHKSLYDLWIELCPDEHEEWHRCAQAVLDADPVRTQALALVELLARGIETWHEGFGEGYGVHRSVIANESKIIADAREFVRKAREASKP